MTTQLYPDDRFGGKDSYNLEEDRLRERDWLINEIIRPELPNIIDNVEKCVDMLYSDQVFKMPISFGGIVNSNAGQGSRTGSSRSSSTSGNNGNANGNSNGNGNGPVTTYTNSGYIKGIITRQGSYILDFQVVLSFPDFKKGKQVFLRMNTGIKFSLYQLEYIGKNLKEVLRLLEDLEVESDMDEFIDKFDRTLKLIITSISILQNPPQDLIFPYDNNFVMKQMFQDYQELCESAHHQIGLELVLFKNELSIDFRNLTKVTKRPWCNIDPETGKSLVDKIKESLKANRNKTLGEILKENNVQLEEPSILNNIMISTFNRESTTLQQAPEFIARCLTFDNKVVTENEKMSITTSDPTLISVASKLNALEHTISNHFTNLET